jgi:uncharacterized membrane protein YhaH (DUF805 family)
MFFLFNLIVAFIFAIFDEVLGIGIFALVYGIFAFIPGLAIAVRRLHDSNHSGWWVLISIIPVVGFLVLLIFLVQKGDPGANQYGPGPGGPQQEVPVEVRPTEPPGPGIQG